MSNTKNNGYKSVGDSEYAQKDCKSGYSDNSKNGYSDNYSDSSDSKDGASSKNSKSKDCNY